MEMKQNINTTEEEIQRHQTSIYVVIAPPAEVDAGIDVPLKVSASCPSKCNLQGSKVRIVDGEGAVVKDVELVSFDREASETDEFIVKVPVEPGSYTWTALFLPYESEEVQHEQSSAPFTFTVKPHLISMATWDIPLPATKGGEFTVMIGAKCSADCSLAGLPFVVRSDEGKQVTTGQLGDEPLPQTSGLYWSEQELVAPDEEGLYTWTVECLASELELPHQVSSSSFRLKTVRPPDRIVTVEVIDKERKTPIKNASVFVHPYRSSTDEHGIAKIEVTEDKHELYVKMQDYLPFQTTVEVAGDVTVKAELVWCPDPYA